jgi:Ferritin-like
MSASTAFRTGRDRLVVLLDEAAELEHLVCCSYLFAAHSMRTEPLEGGCSHAQIDAIRRWRGVLFSLARQEMEHLAIVCNLLTSVGEVASFRRPAYPVPVQYFPVDLTFALRPFSLDVVADFILIELPDHQTDLERQLTSHLIASDLPEAGRFLFRLGDCRARTSRSLAGLYDEIASLVSTLAADDAAALFVGPPDAQVTSTTVFPVYPPVGESMRAYDVKVPGIVDEATALAGITQIRTEGEGGVSTELPSGGHFERLVAVYIELAAAVTASPTFSPARPVVVNPVDDER